MADPYRNFQFEVEIGGFTRAGFAKVSGLKRTTDVTEYREGGDNATPRKLPGQTKYENITLERGESYDNDFVTWCLDIFKLDGVDGANPPAENFRKNVTIYLKDKAGKRVKKWKVTKAWPCEEGVGDLDAGSNDVLTGTLVLCHEGYERTNLAGSGGAGAGAAGNPFEDGI
jgi:phage tail-like protein